LITFGKKKLSLVSRVVKRVPAYYLAATLPVKQNPETLVDSDHQLKSSLKLMTHLLKLRISFNMVKRRYMLDTNILSALIKRTSSPLAERVSMLDSEEFCTSIVVACELRYGVVKKGSQSLTTRVNQLLACIDILPLNTEVEDHYAAIRVALEKVGPPIGHNDLFIAAHARSLDLIVVTDNVSEFSRVSGLAVENWLKR
jgi:tRNA(fMet)-specific endonuclease VapC